MRRLLLLVLGSIFVLSCGGKSSDSAVTQGPNSTETLTTETLTTEILATEAPATTLAPISELDYLTAPVSPAWSTTGNRDFGALSAAQLNPGDSARVGQQLFGQPFDVSLPPDALFHAGMQWVTKGEDGKWNSWGQVDYATMTDVVELENAITDGFSDDRFTPGVRVESTLGDGVVIVTLNFPATDAAAEQGWDTMTISVGPELDGLDPTGRNAVSVRWEQNVDALNEIAIPTFLRGWLAELPVPTDIDVAEFHASSYDLGELTVNIEASFTTSADRFDAIARDLAQERSAGALTLEEYTLPDDLSTVNEIDFGFFPTLAANDLIIEISRDLADTSAPLSIRFAIDIRFYGGGDY